MHYTLDALANPTLVPLYCMPCPSPSDKQAPASRVLVHFSWRFITSYCAHIPTFHSYFPQLLLLRLNSMLRLPYAVVLHCTHGEVHGGVALLHMCSFKTVSTRGTHSKAPYAAEHMLTAVYCQPGLQASCATDVHAQHAGRTMPQLLPAELGRGCGGAIATACAAPKDGPRESGRSSRALLS